MIKSQRFLRQFIRFITLLIATCAIAFLLMEASPIDPVQSYIGAGVAVSPEQREQISAYWGLDQSPIERFYTWGNHLLHGDFGDSLIYRRPVLQVIGEKFTNSFCLMLAAWLGAGLIGLFLGCLMGLYENRWPDKILKTISYLFASTPAFWLGLLLLLFFAVYLELFPIGFSAPIGVAAADITWGQRLYHLFLPALTLSLTSFANIALHTREKLIAIYHSDFILFAKARGESNKSIFLRHGLRNILLPAISLQFASFSELFGGSVLAETVFSYPGLGQAAVNAGLRGDIPLLLGITLFSVIFVFCGNLMADILYGRADPRTKEACK